MIAFEISVDGRKPCVAGIPDLGVTTLMVSRVRRVAHDPDSGQPIPGRLEEELTLEVAGLAHDPDGASVNLRWLQESLRIGQRITLTVVDVPDASPPQVRHREDPAWVEQRKREYYERLKRDYGDA